MFEKIKDFLYDISDVVVSLLIIGAIFYAVSWKISDTLSVDINEPVIINPTEATTSPAIVVTPVNPDDPDAGENPDGETPTEATTEAATEAPTETAVHLLENFTVEEGQLGYTIGKNLEAKGFIEDTNDFVKRLIEMGYDSKLRAGTFKISKADHLDTIIRILAGERR